MTKRIPKEVSAYMSKIGKAGWRAKAKKIIQRAAQKKSKLPNSVIGDYDTTGGK